LKRRSFILIKGGLRAVAVAVGFLEGRVVDRLDILSIYSLLEGRSEIRSGAEYWYPENVCRSSYKGLTIEKKFAGVASEKGIFRHHVKLLGGATDGGAPICRKKSDEVIRAERGTLLKFGAEKNSPGKIRKRGEYEK